MNVGQILETHLGWAALGMGKKIGQMLEEHYTEDSLRAYLADCFRRQKDVLAWLPTANVDEMVQFARKYKRGVTTATPVFAGAAEAEIKGLSRRLVSTPMDSPRCSTASTLPAG